MPRTEAKRSLKTRPLQAPAGLKRRRKSEDVIDAIGLKIVSGELAPGVLLPTETRLAQSLGLSRPSLREGLRALARKGLVDARTRRGTLVNDRLQWDLLDADVLRWIAAAPPDPAFFMDLLDLRVIFEPASARLAASRANPEQILAIENAFEAMAGALPADVEACCRHDLAFHELIVGATGNRLLIRIAAAIRTALLAAFTLSSNARESYENSLNEHWAVAAAIRRRSPDEADHAMRQLLAGAARDLAPAYNRARPKQGSLRTATGVMSSSQRDRSSVQGRARQPKEERQ